MKHFQLFLTVSLTIATWTMSSQPIQAESSKMTKVACVGDSITFGATMKDRKKDAYPAQLQRLLGKAFVVQNFGVSGTTMLQHGNAPWTRTRQAKKADAFLPDGIHPKAKGAAHIAMRVADQIVTPHGLHPVFPLLRYLLHATGNPISPTLYNKADTQTFPTSH